MNTGPIDWIALARARIAGGGRAVLALVVAQSGSVPRDCGSWMLVDEDTATGTLGGGNVEHAILGACRDMLAGRREWRRTGEQFILGPDLGQCCGGSVDILVEPLDESADSWLAEAGHATTAIFPLPDNLRGAPPPRPSFNSLPLEGGGQVLLCEAALRCEARGGGDAQNTCRRQPAPNPDAPVTIAKSVTALRATPGVFLLPLADRRPALFLFGAGHVGAAVAAMAGQLALRLEVIDSRADMLAALPCTANIRTRLLEDPAGAAADIPAGARVLVMTHSHALDYRIVAALAPRRDIAFLGLIGSATKAARFRQRLARDGVDTAGPQRLICPIGLGLGLGKEPGAIALEALAQIMALDAAAGLGDTELDTVDAGGSSHG